MRKIRFGLLLTASERSLITQLAEIEGGFTRAALIRLLIYRAAQDHGLLVQNKQNIVDLQSDVDLSMQYQAGSLPDDVRVLGK